MKRIIPLILIPFFFMLSCEKTTTVIKEKYPDGSPKIVNVYKGSEVPKNLIHETSYYPGKKLQMEGDFKNGVRDGKWVFYYENGNKWSEGYFRKGKSNGKRTTYYENGKKRYEAYYKDDQRVGKWNFYDENGKLVKSVDFDVRTPPSP